MSDSILDSVKSYLGISSDYNAFDQDIIMDINGCFMILSQLSCGKDNFFITSSKEVWSDFTDSKNIEGIKNYIFMKTKLMFDPPSNSFVVNSYEKLISEFEWRLNHQCEKFE